MGESPESISGSRNENMKSDFEIGVSKSFEEHMRELKDPSPLLTEKDNVIKGNEDHERDIANARNAVLEAFNNKGNMSNDPRIVSCKNRVFREKLSPKYDNVPNVFRTDEESVYRATGIDQVADIINCGYVRPSEGKVKGGHKNEVFWSAGGDKLNYVDDRLILETSANTVKEGQIGAVSLDDLTAVWIRNGENGKRENKLDAIKRIKRTMGKDEQISVEELNKMLSA